MDIKVRILCFAVLLLTSLPARATIVWSEEFDGPEIDTETWIWDVGNWGFGNGQMEYNTARSANSFIEDGSLVIQALREDYFGSAFTSARILTQGRFAFRYGDIEARIKMPNTADGLWTAFWMLGNNFPGVPWPDAGEVDIIEIGSKSGIAEGMQQRRFNTAMHFSNAAGEKQSNVFWGDAPVDLTLDYHLYRLSWTPTEMTFYFDGQEIVSWDITADYMTEFHQPHFIVLNLAVGDWGGPDGYTDITTPEAVTATFPAQLKVDWIRVEDNGFTEVFLGEDAEEDGLFGVFTETTPVDNALVYGDPEDPAFDYGYEAALFTWNNMVEAAVPATPSEGTEVWSFDIAAGDWFGMGVFLPNFRNMRNYSDGFLHFDIKTTLTDDIRIGIKSSRGGEYWQIVGDETDGLGFARDGQWQTVSVPLNGYMNIDFHTIHQIFMIAADPASASTTLSIDNVYWEPSVERPRPSGGNLGVFTETAAHMTAGEYELGVDGEFFVWGDTLLPVAQTPFEGDESLSLASAPGMGWFGAAFTPAVKYNLEAFDNPNGKLNFAMRTSSQVKFYVGLKSGNVIGPDTPWGPNTGPSGVGQVWIPFTPGDDPYGFVRDGNWHAVEIPISDIASDIDLTQVSQLFQILGVDGPISGIELDDIYYSGGRAFETNLVAGIAEDGFGISWPSTAGTSYQVEWTDSESSHTEWTPVGPVVIGDWSIKTVFDPLGPYTDRIYRVIELP